MNPLSFLCRHTEHRKRLGDYRGRLYRAAYAWTHDAALADDLTQETLARGLRRIDQLRDPAAFPAWLFGILNNCWRDHLRRERPHDACIDELMDEGPSAEDRYDQERRTSQVRAAVSRLPMGQRQVMTLVDLEGFSYAEVAQALEIPIGTVMSRLCRARRALTIALEPLAPTRTARPPALRRIK